MRNKKHPMVIGEKINKWTILEDLDRNGDGRRCRVQCECGDIHIRFYYSIKTGRSVSCMDCGTRNKEKPSHRFPRKKYQPEIMIDKVIKFEAKPIEGSVWDIAWGNNE